MQLSSPTQQQIDNFRKRDLVGLADGPSGGYGGVARAASGLLSLATAYPQTARRWSNFAAHFNCEDELSACLVQHNIPASKHKTMHMWLEPRGLDEWCMNEIICLK